MLTPLTPEEQQFAADNHGCLQWAIRCWGKNNARTDFNVYRLGETIYIEKLSKNSKNKED